MDNDSYGSGNRSSGNQGSSGLDDDNRYGSGNRSSGNKGSSGLDNDSYGSGDRSGNTGSSGLGDDGYGSNTRTGNQSSGLGDDIHVRFKNPFYITDCSCEAVQQYSNQWSR